MTINFIITNSTITQVMMMHEMLLDLLFFVNLVAIFLIAYGVSTAAIMNPNKNPALSGQLVSS